MNLSYLLHSAKSAFTATLIASMFSLGTYVILEPVVSRSASDTDTFIITQSVGEEISFTTEANDVVLSPSVGGVTGGESSGTTTVVIQTNAPGGYNMTIQFSTTTAMQGNTQGGEIQNYTTATPGVPDFGWSVGANTAEFGYSINASTTSDLDTSFRNNGAACNNAGGGDVAWQCWMSPSTTPETIINRISAAQAATTSLAFKVEVTPNPAHAIPTDTYTATATLTATTQ